MGMFDAGDAAAHLDAATGYAIYPQVTGSLVRLGSTVPTPVADMTEINGAGYAPGGQGVSWAAASGSPASATTAAGLLWLNSSAASWPVAGLEVWDPSPQRHFQGTPSGGAITVAPGNTLAIPAGNLTAQLS